jgi:hypothetical protein
MRGPGRKNKVVEIAQPSARAAHLVIPTILEASDAYRTRIGDLLGRIDTHVYIDTSFLMWATKIGPASRGELLDWLRTDLGERAHVPTWSAHEYLRHHVAGTIVEELTKKSAEVSQLMGSTFSYFRPFLDDPALPAAEGWDRLRASTRDAVNTLGRLAQAATDWKRAYPAHAEQIIQYVNERVLAVGSLFEDLPSIAMKGAARYEGRIPPGYQDRRKKGDGGDDDPEETSVIGANRYGDLIFWNEALSHASEARAAAIVVMTNDRKNDWRMGGEMRAAIDNTMLSLKKAWRPVPRIHPMLALEAGLAGVLQVELIDSQYLAAYLRGVDADRVGAFADVAIVPDPPAPPTKSEERAAAVQIREAADDLQAKREAAESLARAAKEGHRFPDDPAVRMTRAALAGALLKSRDGPDSRGSTILQRVRTSVDSAETFGAVLTQENLAGMDHIALASMARALHDRVVTGEPGYSEALVDLVPLLEELPLATAGALLLGLLASMYLEPGAGTSRLPPSSPASTMLLAALGRPFADSPAAVIGHRLAGNETRPLFIPTEELVDVRFDIEPDAIDGDELRSLKIAGVETLIAAQDDPALRLRNILCTNIAKGAAILDHAAGLFTLPRNRLGATADEEEEYNLTETIGFRSPAYVSRNKEQS